MKLKYLLITLYMFFQPVLAVFAEPLTPVQRTHVEAIIQDSSEAKKANKSLGENLEGERKQRVDIDKKYQSLVIELENTKHSWAMKIGNTILRLLFILAIGFVLRMIAAFVTGPYGFILSIAGSIMMAVGSLGMTLLPQVGDNIYFRRIFSKG